MCIGFALPFLDLFWHQFWTTSGQFGVIFNNVDDIFESGAQILHTFATFGKSWDHEVNPGGSERTNGSKNGAKMKPDVSDFSIFCVILAVQLLNGSESRFSPHLGVKI